MSDKVHPQTLAVVGTRAIPLGLEVFIGDVFEMDFSNRDVSAVIFQYPDTNGAIYNFENLVADAQAYGVRNTLICIINVSFVIW